MPELRREYGVRMRGVPTKMPTITAALRLREARLSYAVIAVVMSIYHDDDRSADSWRMLCRRNGAEPGTSFSTAGIKKVAR